MTNFRGWPAGLLVASIFALASGEAWADGGVAQAAFREGREALRVGDYELACARFLASEEAEPSGGARLNLGDCALRKNDFVEAERLYRGAALLSDGEKRAFAEQRAVAARAKAGTLRVRWSSSGAARGRVEIDGHVVAVPVELPVNPGRHTIRVIGAGYAEEAQTIDVASALTAEIELAPTATPAGPATASPVAGKETTPKASGRSPLSYVLMGVGGVALVGGAVTGFVAKGARDSVDEKCAGQKPCAIDVWEQSGARNDYDRAKTWALISTTSFIGGAVLVVAGGTLWFTTAPAKGGQTVSIAGRF